MFSEIPRYFYPLFLGLSIFILLIGLWVLGPELVESAYRGKLISIIDSLIPGPKGRALEEYLIFFDGLLALAFMAGVILVYLLLVLFIVEKRKSTVFHFEIDRHCDIFSLAERYWFFFGLSLILVWITYVLTIVPGATYLNIMVHDTFVYFDGAYRLSQGQVPHLDFHTPLGALAYLLPYLGFSILNKFPGSLEVSNFIVAILVLVISIHVLSTRYRVLPAMIVLIYLILLIIVPMNIGGGGQNLSHAMYYNRYGWVFLSMIFLFFIEPEKKSPLIILVDAICIGSLVTFLFYIKITYFLFAIAIFPLMIFSSRFCRQVAIFSFALFVMAIIKVELMFTGLHYQYLLDLLMAIEASGTVRGGLFHTLKLNINELILSAFALFLILRGIRIIAYDYGYIVLVILSSLMLINQNAQSTGLITLIVLLLWSHEISSRNEILTKGHEELNSQKVFASTAILSFIILFVSHTLVSRTIGLSELYKITHNKKAQYSTNIMPDLFVGERHSILSQVVIKKNAEDIFNEMRVKRRKQPLTQGEYVETIEQGLLLIGEINKDGNSVIVFDLANPFSFLLSAKPPIGDYSWFHKGRNISNNNYVKPEKLFKSVEYVMIPQFPMEPLTTQFLIHTYGTYIKNKFKKIADNAFWKVYKKVLSVT